VAVLRNISGESLALGRPDALPIKAGDEITVENERFAGTAWPKSTWELVTKPGKGYVDRSPEDAYVFVTKDEADADAETPDEENV
jgi:hypothetical protein